MKPKACFRCGGEMEIGFLADNAFLGRVQLGWGRGEPVQSLTGTASPTGLDPYPITSFRCTKCGILESYVLQ